MVVGSGHLGGESELPSDPGAWIWTNDAMQLIATKLATYHVDLSAWSSLDNALCVSSDGKIVARYGETITYFDDAVGWIANFR